MKKINLCITAFSKFHGYIHIDPCSLSGGRGMSVFSAMLCRTPHALKILQTFVRWYKSLSHLNNTSDILGGQQLSANKCAQHCSAFPLRPAGWETGSGLNGKNFYNKLSINLPRSWPSRTAPTCRPVPYPAMPQDERYMC